MSKTLFIYVFRNLIVVFLLASGVIAGIMSFGGLLRPLTEHGLDLGQVGQMLAYAMPAMTTYSYPIAALFATTIVYGRLAADNEVTAVRAAGISLGPFGLGMPALVLGLVCALLSLVSLSFIVPAATLKVEKTLVSNIGQFVVNRIEQQHQVRLQQPGGQSPLTVYARNAQLAPPDPNAPNEQIVTLTDVSIVTYVQASGDKRLQVPDEFYIAREARAYIRQDDDDESGESPVIFRAELFQGMKFPRTVIGRSQGAIQGGVGTQAFGPFELRSPLRENTKFMAYPRLRQLLENPEKSRRMSETLRNFVRSDQERKFLSDLQQELTYGLGIVKFKSQSGDEFTLRPGTLAAVMERDRLVLGTSITPDAPPESVRLIQKRSDAPSIESVAREAHIRVFADAEAGRIAVTVAMIDAIVSGPGYQNPRSTFERSFNIAMPTEIAALGSRSAAHYLSDRSDILPAQKQTLYRNALKQFNSVVSEMHSRASFAISCLVLTMVGYGLGVMFRSGNYLTAFAVSVVPALLSIVLIVTGQHICENVPPTAGPGFQDPLRLGLTVIWTGNIVVLAIAVGLMVKLRRT
jgi:lipopolysaccharide export LptBFGC system permease protein LptF